MKKKILIAGMWILAMIIMIISCMLAIKWYMITEIMKNVEKNTQITTYMISSTDYAEGHTMMTNGNVTYWIRYSKITGKPIYTSYSIKDENIEYRFNTDKSKYEVIAGGIADQENELTYDLYEPMILKDKIKALFTWKVKSEKINGEKCYYIKKNINDVADGEEYEFWIDKDNYCKIKTTVKESFSAGNPSHNRYYSVYTDEEIVENCLKGLREEISKQIETEQE